jgi:nucleoside 2-deoxyribosyltransferase
MRVYLAGPDVFRPDAARHGAALKAVCAEMGLQGVFPLDAVRGGTPPAWLSLSPARRIALCNEAHMRGCVAVIANLTPFRGPSADAGTVFEVGFARALGLPVYGWTEDARGYTERVVATARLPLAGDPDGTRRDADGMEIEAFGCVDNLMLDGAIAASGGCIVAAEPGSADPLAAFRACCRLLAAQLVAQSSASCGG